MTTSKTKIARAHKNGKYVLVNTRGYYIEHIEKTGSIVMPLTTADIDKALRTNKPDELVRMYGIQNYSIETFAENNK
jgi:hypothetical protein